MAELEVRGLTDVSVALVTLDAQVKAQILADAINAGAQVIALEMAQRAPHRSGKLSRNIETVYSIANMVAEARIGPSFDVFYGGILNQGAKPHKIPKFRSRLRRWERAKGLTLKAINAEKGPMAFGGHVYSRINHPGVKARPFILSALNIGGPRAIEAMHRTVVDGVNRVAATVPKGG